MIVTKAKIT